MRKRSRYSGELETVAAPPPGMLSVIGLDPGIRTGCKVAVVDTTGKFLENAVIYPLGAEAGSGGARCGRWPG